MMGMRSRLALYGAVWIGLAGFSQSALADEGGISFWLPGQYASLAAVPATPGWSVAAIYYHAEADAGANAAFPRGGRIDLGIDGRGDLGILGPTYAFDEPLFGAGTWT